jgi:hypothetical protein
MWPVSQVKSPIDLCILLLDDTDTFTTRPPVDLDAAQILETMESSRALPIPQISPGDMVESGVSSVDPSDATSAKELPCPDDYVDALEDQIDCVSSLFQTDHPIFYRPLIEMCSRSTFILLVPCRFWILDFDGMPESLLQNYST